MKLIYEGKEFIFEEPVNGFGFLKNANPSIIKESLNYVLNGKNYDMATPIAEDGEISFITKDKKDGFIMKPIQDMKYRPISIAGNNKVRQGKKK